MKSTTLFAAVATGLFLCSVSCERHSWDEVKKLHEGHGSHGHGAGHAEGEHADHAGAEHKDEHGTEKHEEKHGEEHAKPGH